MSKNAKGILISAIVLLAAVVIFFVSIALGTRDYRKFNSLMRNGDHFLAQDYYEDAADSYMEALKMAPGNSQALNGFDRAYRYWAGNEEGDDLLLAAQIRDQEADELEAFNEDVHSGEIRRTVESARREAINYRNEEARAEAGVGDPYDFYDDWDEDDWADDYFDYGWDDDYYDYEIEDPAELLGTAYAYMSTGDYERMRNVDGSDGADYLISMMKSKGQDHMLFTPDYEGEDDYTGEALGVYIVPEGYYFFYGDYVDGVRSGDGSSFWVSGSFQYETFSGQWDDDAPNGKGTMYVFNDGSGTETYVSGSFKDGMQDGPMSYEQYYSWSGSVARGTYTADEGDADEIKLSIKEKDNILDGYTAYVKLDDDTILSYDPKSEYLAALGYRYR